MAKNSESEDTTDAPTSSEQLNPTVLNPTILPGAESLVGATLKDRYVIERELGRGGFGAVYLALDRQLHSKQIVVKVLLDEAFQSDWVVKKFHQEIEALSRIEHPGIIGIMDTGELANGKPFIVMQYVAGVSLRSVLKPEGMSLERAADILKQLGRALGAAHDKGIFHRDLKPENIMLQRLGDDEEQVKIIDFGIARIKNSVISPSTVTTGIVGTIAYMSPEQLSNRHMDAASDIYSMGVISYEMVAGRRPFNPESSYELLEMQRGGVKVKPKDLRPGLPEEAQDVILRALAFAPKGRYSKARDFGDSLHRALQSEDDTLRRNESEPSGTPARTVASRPDVSKGVPAPNPTLDTLVKTMQASEGPLLPKGFGQEAGFSLPTEPKKRGINYGLISIGALILLGAMSFGLWYTMHARTGQTAAGESVATSNPPEQIRSLNFWMTVQKMRNGKPYEAPFETAGQEIFESGWQFRMNVFSPQLGYLYLLNEGPTAGARYKYSVLFPDPIVNGGSAQLKAEQKIQTDWLTFVPNEGTEKFWMVWAEKPVTVLEAVKSVVNAKDKGEIRDAGQTRAVGDFLTSHAATKPDTQKDREKKQTKVTGKGEILVHLLELEHH